MATKKTRNLELSAILQAIDRRHLEFYSNLTVDEKKDYVPLVLMRYMSSLTDQNPNAAYAVVAANDLVNIGFWELTKYPDLQHLLLCLTGIGGKPYRPWLSASKGRSKNNKIDNWLLTLYPDINKDEIELIKRSYDLESWTNFVKSSGVDDATVKELVAAWKKQE